MKKKIFITLVCLSVCFTQTLCYGQKSQERLSGFTIKNGDVLSINVYGAPGMFNPGIKARVSEKGEIKMPLLGEVKVVGLTAGEAALKFDKLFKDGYLADPQVTVFIAERGETSETRIDVIGSVARQGSFPVEGTITLVKAIALAGGASKPSTGEHPNLSSIKVIRQEEGEEKIFYVDLDTEGRDFTVYPGDTIFVEEYEAVVVTGNVVNPGATRIYRNFSLSNAIQFAGGALPNANLEKVMVIRREENEEGKLEDKTYIVNYLEEGPFFGMKKQDRVIVEAYGSFTIYGEVRAAGTYYISKDLTAMDAIILAGNFTEFASKNGVKIIRYVDGKRRAIKVPAEYIMKTGNRSKDVFLEDGDTIVVPESWF